MPINFSDKSLWNVQAAGGINNVNVSTLGELNQIMLAAGAVIPYGSQGDLGKRLVVTEAEAASLSYTTTGTLYGGIYQPVQVSSAATAANVARGKAAFLLDSGASGYVVTDYAHADILSGVVGVFLNSVTPGNYGFVQVHGKASCLFGATLTDTSANDAVVVNLANADGTFDALATTAITALLLGKWIGQCIVAPTASTISTVFLKALMGRY